MLIDRDNSALLVIDVQTRLLNLLPDWQRLLDNTIWLVQVAQKLKTPVMASEQYPQGLGPTHAALRTFLPDEAVAAKAHFSCTAAQCLTGLPGAERRQIILCGMEAHVCVMQTALELRWQGREVFVVGDVIGSRNPADRDFAIARMRAHGIEIVTREMVAFEWMRQAGTDEFREISKNFLR